MCLPNLLNLAAFAAMPPTMLLRSRGLLRRRSWCAIPPSVARMPAATGAVSLL